MPRYESVTLDDVDWDRQLVLHPRRSRKHHHHHELVVPSSRRTYDDTDCPTYYTSGGSRCSSRNSPIIVQPGGIIVQPGATINVSYPYGHSHGHGPHHHHHRYEHHPYADGGGGYGYAYRCGICGAGFPSQGGLDDHKSYNNRHCAQCRECFAYWSDHVESASHTTCPFDGCGRVFSSNSDFKIHFSYQHKYSI